MEKSTTINGKFGLTKNILSEKGNFGPQSLNHPFTVTLARLSSLLPKVKGLRI